MNTAAFNRLHELRMENTAAGYAMDELRPRFDRLVHRHENGTAPRAVTAYQLFQTPPDLAGKMASMLDLPPSDLCPPSSGFRLLEPSAGLGVLLDAVGRAAPRAPLGEIVAIEMAANLCGELYRQERGDVQIMQRDFLTVTPQETGLFDAVIMNPPFHMRSDIKHILHARTFLKRPCGSHPGGKLIALCLDTPHRYAALRGISETWEAIPAGTFKASGTNVPTILLTLRGENA